MPRNFNTRNFYSQKFSNTEIFAAIYIQNIRKALFEKLFYETENLSVADNYPFGVVIDLFWEVVIDLFLGAHRYNLYNI